MDKVKFKYTLAAQLLRPIKSHATTALVLALIWLIMITLWTTAAGEYIFAVIAISAYFLSIYNSGFDSASDDKKPYSPLTPKPYKGLYLPVLLTAVNIIFIIIYKCAWMFGEENGVLNNVWSIIGNVLSVIWFCVYKSVIGMDKGHFEPQGYIIIIFLPYVASFLGYFAGCKDFDIYGKLNSLAYEQNKKKQNKNKK